MFSMMITVDVAGEKNEKTDQRPHHPKLASKLDVTREPNHAD